MAHIAFHIVTCWRMVGSIDNMPVAIHLILVCDRTIQYLINGSSMALCLRTTHPYVTLLSYLRRVAA